MDDKPQKEQNSSYLVTGANGGLGLAICHRILDEFLQTRSSHQKITLIFTARSSSKCEETAKTIRRHIARRWPAPEHAKRVSLAWKILDLTALARVRAVAAELRAEYPSLEAVILNAGYGGFTGVDWPAAFWYTAVDFMHAMTWPTFKKALVGSLTQRQTTETGKAEPPLGEVFCSNVFGHYMLVHDLMPILSSDTGPSGRIIWISSVEALAETLSGSDIQGLRHKTSYECSKRLTDTLVLTAHLPATKPYVNRFLTPSTETPTEQQADPVEREPPKMYLTHPGICATSILAIPFFMTYLMYMSAFLARWLGSPWHTISAYSGACAPVWAALYTPRSALDQLEEVHGKGKWGSTTDILGNARVTRTTAQGWGYSGVVGGPEEVGGRDGKGKKRSGERRGTKVLDKDAREGFEELGRECWRQMEELREQWENILARA